MICEACKREMHPVWEIAAPENGRLGGLVPKCPFNGCRAAVPQSVIDAERLAAEQKLAAEIAAEAGPRPVAAPPPPADKMPDAAGPPITLVETIRGVAGVAVPRGYVGDEPLDVFALATRRLQFVRGKVAELRGYEREEKKLEALLTAAEVLDVTDEPAAFPPELAALDSARNFVGH